MKQSDKLRRSNNKFNALKTSAYSKEILLPWENADEYEEHFEGISRKEQADGPIEEGFVRDMAENRWLRNRQRRTTAISTRRHSFGRELEESGARSWREALLYVTKSQCKNFETCESIDESLREIASKTRQLIEEPETSDVEERSLQEMAKECTKGVQILAGIKLGLDAERNFFDEYSPKQLRQRINLENALDAQFDKIRGRLEREQEARLIRERMRAELHLLSEKRDKSDADIVGEVQSGSQVINEKASKNELRKTSSEKRSKSYRADNISETGIEAPESEDEFDLDPFDGIEDVLSSDTAPARAKSATPKSPVKGQPKVEDDDDWDWGDSDEPTLKK